MRVGIRSTVRAQNLIWTNRLSNSTSVENGSEDTSLPKLLTHRVLSRAWWTHWNTALHGGEKISLQERYFHLNIHTRSINLQSYIHSGALPIAFIRKEQHRKSKCNNNYRLFQNTWLKLSLHIAFPFGYWSVPTRKQSRSLPRTSFSKCDKISAVVPNYSKTQAKETNNNKVFIMKGKVLI